MNTDPTPARHPRPTPRATTPNPRAFFLRALRLRCPECGVSPMFVPVGRTRSLRDWLTPLDGCPRCGYAYDREDGYFLMATWGVHYFAVAGFGLVLGLVLERLLSAWDVWWVVAATAAPTVVFGFLFARHAKALYVAVDHFCDPHGKHLKHLDRVKPAKPAGRPRPPGE